jgi:alkylated DNA repair dioxygenase AlkB
LERIELSAGSWVDVGRAWCQGADALLVDLAGQMPWKQRRRPMYGRVLDDPRLSCRAPTDGPHAGEFDAIRRELSSHYGRPLSAPFLNYYRDGHDSVAFHADRELRQLDDTLVAILTLGGPRPFLLRPRAGGRSLDLRPASGDLVVMGGRCQLDWLHGIPKVAHCGPRISLSMRWCPTVR